MSGLEILLNIAGGIALLLWAVRMVRTGFMRAFGADLRRLFARSLGRPLFAFGAGVAAAGVLQSSTATAMLAVSFASRGLIAAGVGLALMLGADLGSTLVVQILSFGLEWLSPALLLAGVVSFMASRNSLMRHLGRTVIGLGLLLLSLSLIVSGSEPLRESEVLRTVIGALGGEPFLALLLAALLTWLSHSSVAMVLFIMSLAGAGLLPPGLALALVLGANVGAGIVPFVLTMSDAPAARRIPLGNLMFRGIGALLVLPFIDLVIPWLMVLEQDAPRLVANFHTAFNLGLAAVFLPLCGVTAKLAERLIPDRSDAEGRIQPKYLDPNAISNPPVALGCAAREVMRMADVVETMLRETIEVFRSNDEKLLSKISNLDDDVDALHEAIKLYLTNVSRNASNEEESKRAIDSITFTTNLEHVGDIIDKNLLELAQKKIRNRLSFSEEGWSELKAMHGRVVNNMQLAMGIYVSSDLDTARQLIAEKERFRTLEREGGEKHLERLRSGQVQSIETSALHLDILRDLKRINSHLASVAYPLLDAKGELRDSRLRVPPEREASGEKDQRVGERTAPGLS